MGFLPESFAKQIDFVEHPGKFKNHGEPLLAYSKNEEGKNVFLFKNAFNEMLAYFIGQVLETCPPNYILACRRQLHGIKLSGFNLPVCNCPCL